MLEPLIVSTNACELIAKELKLRLSSRSHGIYGTTTTSVKVLIVGDVDSDFTNYLSKFAVDLILVRTIPRNPQKTSSSVITELFGLEQLDSIDSGAFPVILVADTDVLKNDATLRQLWRISDGHTTVLMWVPGYAYDVITSEVLKKLGCVDATLSKSSLAKYDYPGNFLVKFSSRKDSSPFFVS